MSERIHVTEAECEVLEALWRHGPLPPARLIAEVKVARPWAETTIKTLMSRLAQKKVVVSEKVDGRLQYRALIERDAYVCDEVDALVARLFAGDRAALAAYLANPTARTSGT
jgi:predicted transcriptional regulator